MWQDKTLQAETHAIGSVPACTAEGVVPASTIREKHAKGSRRAVVSPDENSIKPAPKFNIAEENKEKLILSDAKDYKRNFEEHAQFVFSHVQHHWHHEKGGVRTPHAYCRKTGFKNRKVILSMRGRAAKRCASKVFRRRDSSI